MKWQRAWVWPVLIVLMGIVCWLVFIADGWSINRLVLRIWGVLAGLGLVLPIAVVDIAANVVMLAPLIFLLGIGLPKVWWWVWGILGCAGSGAIELLQGAYLARNASWIDWVANSAGAFLAAGAAHLVNRWLQRRETAQPSSRP